MTEPELTDESALGVYAFSWRVPGRKVSVEWAEGMPAPVAYYGTAEREITDPARFGWDGPPSGSRSQVTAEVRAFAQAFAGDFTAWLRSPAGGQP